MGKEQQKLRILLLGAHPDDCESCAGGYAAIMAERGHIVKLASMTDGCLGHYQHPPAELVKIRSNESAHSAALIGAEWEHYPNTDGSLICDLNTRKMLVRRIRSFAPDLIITHRPNDYHADHRNTSLLVQDASYLLRVPGFCPDTPAMERMPYIMHFHDWFENPLFKPTVVVAVDDVMDLKYRMMACHSTQYFEWLPWLDGRLDEVPAEEKARLLWLRRPLLDEPDPPTQSIKQPRGEKGQYQITNQYRELLKKRYGAYGERIRFCEAFAACEYGAAIDEKAISLLFPT